MLKTQLEQQSRAVDTIVGNMRVLEGKLSEAKMKKDTLKARAQSAKSVRAINDMVRVCGVGAWSVWVLVEGGCGCWWRGRVGAGGARVQEGACERRVALMGAELTGGWDAARTQERAGDLGTDRFSYVPPTLHRPRAPPPSDRLPAARWRAWTRAARWAPLSAWRRR